MIVRLDFESSAPAVAEIDHARVLAGRNDHAFAGGWQSLEMNAGRFVGAVLRPHDGEDTELRQVRFAAKQLFDSLEFLRSEIVGGDNFRSDHCEAKDRRERLSLLPITFLDQDRKSTRLNSSHMSISYAVFCLKKKKKTH